MRLKRPTHMTASERQKGAFLLIYTNTEDFLQWIWKARFYMSP